MVNKYLSRLFKIKEVLHKKNTDGFLITNILNVRYLCGFKGSSGALLITRKRNIFLTDFRYKSEAEEHFNHEFGPDTALNKDMEWDILIDRTGRPATIKKACRRHNIRSLAFEVSVSYKFFKELYKCASMLEPMDGVVENLRIVKDMEEIGCLREAIRRAEAAFLDVRPYIKKGRRENEIARMLAEKLEKRGCRKVPFDIIVASGTNAALPHAKTTDKKLSAGDLVVVDWGGEADGYLSDMTRTLLLKGADISREKNIYHTVLKANKAAISIIKPDTHTNLVDRAARDIIKAAGYGEFFGHGTGHGVGLEIHESPGITWTKKELLRQNMVFTIEPGIYMTGLGGVRIEDMILVSKKGHVTLTTLPKHLDMILN